MAASAVDAVTDQAASFVERLVGIYETQVAPGEVGATGSAQASGADILADKPSRMLLYGRVQSGKTVAMILSAALCLDNGFRVVVVLTTDNVALVKQTAARFKSLDGPRVFSATKEGQSYEWEGQEDRLRDSVATDGIVLVCAKNSSNLKQVILLLQRLDAPSYPVLILDDEADAASLDTTLAARSAGLPSAPAYASTINRLLVENDRPQESGFSIGEILPHSLFVQVTATPYVLLLQGSDMPMRPSATFLLAPGGGYCGGEVFFGAFDGRAGQPQPTTIVIVNDQQTDFMRGTVPAGFAASIDFFVLSACARAAIAGLWPAEGFKHLSHTSHLITDHDVVVRHIEARLEEIRQAVRDGTVPTFFAVADAEIRRSVPAAPSLTDLVGSITSAMRQVEIIRVNARADAPVYGPRLNFMVGGNILGRGLTIDDLLVTYYIREARTSQMDTVWQHARMYGYRRAYLDHMRIYLPLRLGAKFKQIHVAEEELRAALSSDDPTDPILIQVPRSARPTRPNALHAAAITTIVAGRDQIFPYYIRTDPVQAAAVLTTLQRCGVPIGGGTRSDRSTPVPLDEAKALIEGVALEDEDPGLWQPEVILALLRTYEDRLAGQCQVYVRGLQDTVMPTDGWFRGRLSGPEIAMIRQSSPQVPALALMYRGDPLAPDAWYPTLVMPPGAPSYVFNAS
ncbi:Z1 domain-containing protein [Methylobacterium sp. J-090]|uniref:Z1 domain-containing protein n=1 Tax=Methylobacterium sp. J-090 TaxID=2836666 RepID=UPI001FB8DE69|nr:Z1 domain-containing protein [Methylobacterium sp. J-090]MCJ2084302.1 hypothetical protein [Methylobacterium sp. J-090]